VSLANDAVPLLARVALNFAKFRRHNPETAGSARQPALRKLTANEEATVINVRAIDELAQRLATLVPPGFDSARDDLAKTFRATLQSGLERLHLVTREEFEVQRLVLLRTREKLEALEKLVASLEAENKSP